METSRGIHKLKPQAKSKMPTSNLVSTSVDQTQHDQQKGKTKHHSDALN